MTFCPFLLLLHLLAGIFTSRKNFPFSLKCLFVCFFISVLTIIIRLSSGFQSVAGSMYLDAWVVPDFPGGIRSGTLLPSFQMRPVMLGLSPCWSTSSDPGSSTAFPGSIPESAISPRSPSFFGWRMVLRSQDLDAKWLLAPRISLLPLSRQN